MLSKKDFCSQLSSQSSLDYPPPIWSLAACLNTSHGFPISHVFVFLPITILHLWWDDNFLEIFYNQGTRSWNMYLKHLAGEQGRYAQLDTFCLQLLRNGCQGHQYGSCWAWGEMIQWIFKKKVGDSVTRWHEQCRQQHRESFAPPSRHSTQDVITVLRQRSRSDIGLWWIQLNASEQVSSCTWKSRISGGNAGCSLRSRA